MRSLLRALDPLPDDASVPVGWIRQELDGETVEEEDGRPLADLTVAEVAEELDRGASTVRGWLSAGKIPEAYRLHGREWRIPRSALREYLDRQARGEPTAELEGDGDLGAWRDRMREAG